MTRRQLEKLGFKPAAITRMIRAGHLFPVHEGVFSVGRPDLDRRGLLFAAIAACRPEGLASHRAAGSVWGFHDPPPWIPIDILVPRGKHRERTGLRIHHTRYLPKEDRSLSDGLPVTSVVRTLRDLASVLPFPALRDAFEQADRMGLVDFDALFQILARSNGHRGARMLKSLAVARSTPAPKTRSILELRFFRLSQQEGLPAPLVNTIVAGHEVDFHWPAAKLVVETDGGENHSRPADRERDAKRDLDLQLAGVLVVRLSYWQVYAEADEVVARVRSLLRARLPSKGGRDIDR